MLKTLAVSLLFAVATTGALASHAFAIPKLSLVSPPSQQLSGVQNADVSINLGFGGGYNRYRHGNRCDFRRFGCDNFYQGYYYQNRWWQDRGYGFDDRRYDRRYARGYGRAHVEWCSDRYRSYDRRSNTWLSNSGQRRICNSPY
jgi:BA14K-like protein